MSLLGYKMAILLLYLRLFHVSRRFKYATWATMFFVCGYLFCNIVTQYFGCTPASKFWNVATPGHCIAITKSYLAYGSMNVISDFFIFVLPLPMVWRLKLTRKEKIGVSLVFMSGAMCVHTLRSNQGNSCTSDMLPLELLPWPSYDLVEDLKAFTLQAKRSLLAKSAIGGMLFLDPFLSIDQRIN